MRKWTTGALAFPVLAGGVTSLVAGAGPAGAQGTGTPLTGDLDGDHVADRATLVDSGGACSVSVELGLPGGGYGPATSYPFEVPDAQYPYCPDMGVIVDLGGDAVSELVLAWFYGSPVAGEDADLLVLRDFAPVGGFDAIAQPSTIEALDLDADGLVDIYETTDQGDGFRSFLNTPSGELVPGPLQHTWVSGSFELGDFDEDGKTDLAVAYEDFGSAHPQAGVAVVFDDGTRVQLTADEVFGDVELADANGDGHLDIGLIDVATGKPFVWYGDGQGGFTPK
jgi:hypothetical protein